jgi:hypothetical protein
MPTLALPALSAATAWAGLAADGVTPSTALAFTLDTTLETPSADTVSVRIAATTGALGHIARCTFAAFDLSAFDEIRFVLQASRAAPTPAGSTAATPLPFYLELHLGSAALPPGDPGNSWLRRLPIDDAGEWQLIRVSLADLAPAARGALSVVEIRCIDASQAFDMHIDEALAVRPGLLADVERALAQRLDGRVTIGGTPVPAAVSIAGADLPAALPTIAIVPLDARCALERTGGDGQRVDFTAIGYSVRSAPQAYELGYAIEALAANRDEQATLLDYLLGELQAQGQLRVAGVSLTMEAVAPSAPLQILRGVATPRQRLYFRIWAWQEQAAAQLVRPAKTLVLPVDFKEVAHV